MPIIMELFGNNIFLSILIAIILAQLSKIFIFIYKFKQKFHIKDLIVTGGMPSAHSALVGSLTTIIWLNDGFTALFFAVLTFSLIVLRDAMGVRKSVGEEGRIIEKLIKSEKIKVKNFHYSLGHNFKEIAVGLSIGFFSAIFSYFVL